MAPSTHLHGRAPSIFGVSDNFLRLIPSDPEWTPEVSPDGALELLTRLVPDAESVNVEIRDGVEFFDSGGNFVGLRCPLCNAQLDQAWWAAKMATAAASGFADLHVDTPCCGAQTSLNELRYDWPAGFARFVIELLNPGRSWLDASELSLVAAAIGCPVRQVMAHY